MSFILISDGSPFGTHRVLKPQGVLPQLAEKLDNDFGRIWDNEILIDVHSLNIDSAGFTQIKAEQDNDDEKVANRIEEILATHGKMHTPATGSGGMLIGAIDYIGDRLRGSCILKAGDPIVSLVPLSMTPLFIDRILRLDHETDRIMVAGKAVLFENSLYARLPGDLPTSLALAVLEVCGAPAQTARLVKAGNTVAIIGAGGKSGILCAWQAKRRAGINGRVIGIEYSEAAARQLMSLDLCDEVIQLDARNALQCHEAISALTSGLLADIVINCVDIPDTELASIMICRNKGLVYFFGLATSFTKAALGAEGIGKDIDMLIGSGYTKGHAETALNILRQSPAIRRLYERLYT